MRILFICNEYPPLVHGGIGSFTKLIAENLIINNHDAIVVGYGDKAYDYMEEINKVPVIRLKKQESNQWVLISYINMVINRIFFYFKIKKYISVYKPDLVETYDWSAPLIFKPGGCVLVTRLHGSNTAFNMSISIRRTPILYSLERKAIKQSDFVVCVSNYIASITQKSFNINFPYTTIYNGVDTKKFFNQEINREFDEIVLVGRMHPYKGFDDLFKAMNYIFKQHPTVKFTIICNVIETFKDMLMSYVDTKYESRIVFTGRIPNDVLAYFYNKANLSVLPSRTEAFPIIPLESMACGTPVIMADRSSAREMIDDRVDGYLVNSSEPADFARIILEILEDQDSIEAMRTKAREKVLSKFSIEKTLQDNLRFYKYVLSQGGTQ